MKSSIKIMMLSAVIVVGSPLFAEPAATTRAPTTTINRTSAADTTIMSSVQENIAKVSILKGYNITPSSVEGEVTLDGVVNSQAQADAAVSAAKSVSGVKKVKSNIVVKNVSANTAPTKTSTTY